MALQNAGWESLVQRAEQIERRARRRAIVLTVIPVVVALLLLWFTGNQLVSNGKQLMLLQNRTQAIQAVNLATQNQLVQTQAQLTQAQSDNTSAQKTLIETQRTLSSTQEQLKTAIQQRDALQKQLDELKKSLDDATTLMQLATDFSKYEFKGNWALDIKDLSSLYPEQTRTLMSIMSVQKAPWKLGGFSPQEGFDSPAFAAYILAQNRRINVPARFDRTQANVRALLPARTGRPRVGDVVFYEAGYTMFYFENSAGQPFVIGMTPLGVLALKPDFAPVLGYGAVFP